VLKIPRSKLSLFTASLLGIILVVVFAAYQKSLLLDILTVPAGLSSGFVTDARAILNYRYFLNENQRLEGEILKCRKDAVLLKELIRENERLKQLLSFKEQSPYTLAAARIIARDPGNWSRGVVINKGFKQGIRQGNVVITGLGLVGRVLEVSANTSKIILISDMDNAVSARIQRTREEGVVSGTLLGGIVMRYLEKDSDASAGDIVLTSGLARNYPESILIGEVREVKNEPQGLGKYCVIKPAVDLSRLEEVLVIIR
jgi:rod shape-determining protein MreC